MIAQTGYLLRLVTGAVWTTWATQIALANGHAATLMFSYLSIWFAYAVMTIDPPSDERLQRLATRRVDGVDPDPLLPAWRVREIIGQIGFMLALIFGVALSLNLPHGDLISVAGRVAILLAGVGGLVLLRMTVIARIMARNEGKQQ